MSEQAGAAGSADPVGAIASAVASSGLLDPDAGAIVLVSGGADSACLLAGCATFLGPDRVVALHLDHGLRPDSPADTEACAQLCEAFGVELVTMRSGLGTGNVQQLARDARYGEAEALRVSRGLDLIASGHTRTDLAETFLYRLAVSPGARSLLGLSARRGVVVRPLLGLTRERTRELAVAAELPFRDDPSNSERSFARNRVRLDVLPVLRTLNPRFEDAIAETRAELAEDAEALDELASAALGDRDPRGVVAAAELDRLSPAVRRRVLRVLAEQAALRPVPMGRDRAREIVRLAASEGGGEIDLGGGLRAICGHGSVAFRLGPPGSETANLPVPGTCRVNGWALSAEIRPPGVRPSARALATLDASALGASVLVRTWREGDRIRPLGTGGGKSLQDLFTDERVPRAIRHELPVVEADGEIAWIPGLTIGDRFRITPSTTSVAVLQAQAL